jgi:type III secretion protein F
MAIEGLTYNSINSTISQVAASREASLKNTLSEMGDSPSTGDLLKVQQELQQWSMFTQIQSTLVKEVGDTLKGILQKV